MADGTEIEWTDATWNPVTGCSVVSPGCTHCYAMKLAGGRLMHTPSRQGLTEASKAGPVWNGQVRFNEGWLDQPLRWTRPRRIFVCAHGDLFHENVPDAWIDRVFAVMALSPQHTFQVLTKRAKRMRDYLSRHQRLGDFLPMLQIIEAARQLRPDNLFNMTDWPLPNVWLGVSAEDQQRADERGPDLLATPAAVRFVSAEPLLGPIDFGMALREIRWGADFSSRPPRFGTTGVTPSLDWIIVGGESGQRARPMHPAWARSIRDQCAAAGVPFFFKQWGVWGSIFDSTPIPPGKTPIHYFEDREMVLRLGKKATGHLLDGVEHHAFPHPEPVEGRPA